MLVGCAVAAYGQGTGNRHPGRPAPSPTSEPVDLRLIQHFSVLRRGRVGKVNTRLLGGKRPYGIDLNYARDVVAGGQTVSVIPGRTGICLVSWITYGATCAPTSQAITSGIIGSVLCGVLPAGRVAFYALLPDGAENVEVKRFGPNGNGFFGPATPARVVNNLMVAEFDAKRDLPEGIVVDGQPHQLVQTPSSMDVKCQ